jgi:hypothetical protein
MADYHIGRYSVDGDELDAICQRAKAGGCCALCQVPEIAGVMCVIPEGDLRDETLRVLGRIPGDKQPILACALCAACVALPDRMERIAASALKHMKGVAYPGAFN